MPCLQWSSVSLSKVYGKAVKHVTRLHTFDLCGNLPENLNVKIVNDV
jgi:hypothetical protein